MNISRDSRQLTSALSFDIKTVALDGNKSAETASVPFSDLLKREADSLVSAFESPLKSDLNSARNKDESASARINPKEQKEESKLETENQKVERLDLEEEEAFALDLDEDEIEAESVTDSIVYLGHEFAHSFQRKEIQESVEIESTKQDRKPTQFALLKQNEKNAPYASSVKENTNFMEEAKKIADSIFKKDKKEFKAKELNSPNELKLEIPKTSSENIEFTNPKIRIQNGNVTFANFSKTKQVSKSTEKPGVGSGAPSTFSSVSKEVVKKESELPPVANQLPKENVFQKEIPKKKNGSNVTDFKEERKENLDLLALGEKLTRSLGIKEKEFLKTEPKSNSAAEKIKTKEQTEISSAINTNATSSKEENGQMNSGNKNPSSQRDGFSFAAETKWNSRSEELSKSEKSNTPTRQEMQKNLDELVKQARFDIVQNGKSTAEIIMNPKEFGRLTLRVSVDGDKVEGRILVETEEMKDLLTNEIAKLKENFKESGLSLESLLVDVWDQNGSKFSQQNSEDRKFAEEMVRSSYNRSSAREEGNDTKSEDDAYLKPSGALEIFA